ncbi:MAG: HlyD family secretion protein [Bacteriovoracaceae bacterium]
MSEESNAQNQNVQLSWAARSFIEAPSSRVLFFSVSLVLASIVTFFLASYFITIDLTVRTDGQTDSYLGVKEVIVLRSGQLEELRVKEGSLVSAQEVVGHLRIEGSSESMLLDYVHSLKAALKGCREKGCQLPQGTFDAAMFTDPSLKEALSNVSRKFSDYRYSQVELKEKLAREIGPLKQRLVLVRKKLEYLATSKMRNYLLMQKEALDEEKGRLEQQLIASENQLSGTEREKKSEAVHSLELAIYQIENFLEKHRLKAPVSGRVAKLYKTQGSYLREYEPVIAVIPESSPIVAKVNVAAKDVARIKEGDTAFVSIDAYPKHKYGYFSGKLVSIDKVASEAKYVARISIDINSLPRKPAFAVEELGKVKLEPGMGVEVRIITGKTKLLQLMLDKVLGKER